MADEAELLVSGNNIKATALAANENSRKTPNRQNRRLPHQEPIRTAAMRMGFQTVFIKSVIYDVIVKATYANLKGHHNATGIGRKGALQFSKRPHHHT